jgi:GT2 family glycosyltransferase
MMRTLQSWPNNAGALGPKILNPDGSYAPSASYRQFPPRILVGIAILNQLFPFVHHLPLEWLRTNLGFVLSKIHGKFLQPTIAEQVEWLDGISVLFNRRALEDTGLFDEQFFFDMEIGDLLFRMRKKGWEVIYDPQIEIIHLGGYSRKLNPYILKQSIKSMLIYYSKLRPGYVPFIKTLYSIALWIRLLFLNLASNSKNEIQLYRRIRSDLRDFAVSSAYANESIPDLERRHLTSVAGDTYWTKVITTRGADDEQ